MISSIALKRIRKKYDSAHFALHIDDLEFNNSNIHAIVGSNGSGKTSLLKLIALLDKPDTGNILFNNDKNILFNENSGHRLRKKIGFVMQNPYLFNTTAFDNVALGLKIRKLQRSEVASKVRDMMGALKIEYLAKERIKYLSRGEYQKVAIAQALVPEPEVILMDEPAANVDEQSTLSIEEMVKKIHERFKPVIIMTTHSLNQAHRVSPEVISIKEGRIEVM